MIVARPDPTSDLFAEDFEGRHCVLVEIVSAAILCPQKIDAEVSDVHPNLCTTLSDFSVPKNNVN
jgi:hypothetical protein